MSQRLSRLDWLLQIMYKEWKEVISDMNIFVWKLSKIAAQKKVSLGKSNGKKRSNIWKFLFGSGLKSPRKKSFFVVADFALVHPPMAFVLLSASVERCFVSHMRDFYNLFCFFITNSYHLVDIAYWGVAYINLIFCFRWRTLQWLTSTPAWVRLRRQNSFIL